MRRSSGFFARGCGRNRRALAQDVEVFHRYRKNIPLQSVLLCVYYKRQYNNVVRACLRQAAMEAGAMPHESVTVKPGNGISQIHVGRRTPLPEPGAAVCAPSAGCAASACGPGTGGVLFCLCGWVQSLFSSSLLGLRAGVSLETPALSPVTGRFGRRGRRRKHACPNKTKVRPASPNTPQNRGQGQRLPGAVAVRLVFPYTKSGRRRPDRRKKDAGFEHNLPAGLQYYSGDRGR